MKMFASLIFSFQHYFLSWKIDHLKLGEIWLLRKQKLSLKLVNFYEYLVWVYFKININE